MPLDPQAQKVVEMVAALNLKPISQSTPDEARESMRTRTAGLGPVEDVPAVADHRVPVTGGEITVRCLQPRRPRAAPGPGLLPRRRLGDRRPRHPRRHLPVARQRGRAARWPRWTTGWRRSTKFPAAGRRLLRRDAVGRAATPRELGLDPGRIAVGGDSAGGNLAAVIACWRAIGGGPPLALQLLIYPATHHGLDTPSYRDNAEGYLLHRERHALVLGPLPARRGAGPRSARLPAAAPDLAGLPPAVVITAEFDPLRDEGEAYAERCARRACR